MVEISSEQWKVLLKSTKFFKIFENHEVDKIINFSDLVHYPMHKYIIKEKENDSSFYVIVKGHANVLCKTKAATDRKLLTINIGECFGEMAAITHKPRKNYIIAGSDCYVVKINVSTIDTFEEAIQLKLYKQFAVTMIDRLLALGLAEQESNR